MQKMNVGVLGATGMVGQNYIQLLSKHPWFEVTYVAASPRSAGKKYQDAVQDRWLMDMDMPAAVRDLMVEDASDIEAAKGKCSFVFSAVEMGKDAIRDLENNYAAQGIPVVSNNSAHRGTKNVPVLIPEINAGHLDVIAMQQKSNGWDKGFVVVKPNCSVQSYLLPIYALLKAGYEIKKVIVATMQGLSGAGYPGVSSLDIVDNVLPLIKGEEEKSEEEPLKILGSVEQGEIRKNSSMDISAHCNRVPVVDGHTACVSLEFGSIKPQLSEIIEIWENYRSVPQELELPFAPQRPLIYRTENDRPQPRKDRQADKGMAVTLGRLRECKVFDCRFVGLSHNTIRGAAGGGILNAELLKARGFFD